MPSSTLSPRSERVLFLALAFVAGGLCALALQDQVGLDHPILAPGASGLLLAGLAIPVVGIALGCLVALPLFAIAWVWVKIRA